MPSLKEYIKSLYNRPNADRNLDGLRGYAILFVLLGHSSNAGLYIFDNVSFSGKGKLGVYLFFVLSAYLLDRQIIKRLVQDKATNSYWKYYFSRRFLRIYPMYFAALITFWFAYQYGLNIDTISNFENILKHLVLVEGNGIFWSIPAEFKYYLISPVVLLIIHRGFHWAKGPAILFFAFLFCIPLFGFLRSWFPLDETIPHLSFFLTGTAIAVAERSIPRIIRYLRASWVLEGALWISFVAVILIANTGANLLDSSWHSFFCIWFAGLLLKTSGKNGLFSWVSQRKIVQVVGNISFSMYLGHMLVLVALTQFFPNLGNAGFYVFMALTGALGLVSHYFVERPLSMIKPVKKKMFRLHRVPITKAAW